MSTYDPLQSHRRLWNGNPNTLDEILSGTVIMHQNLEYLNSCKAIVRRDYKNLNGKVRIIGGGAVIDGPMYAGFVGPGMLTAAVFGLYGTASTVPTSDSIFEVTNYIIKDKQNTVKKEILLLVQDCAEYFLNFLIAKNKLESKGVSIKIVLVRDELSDKLSAKPLSPRSPSGLLLVYKIAGAMSEQGKSLDEIYNTCYEIIKNGAIFSIGVYIVDSVFGKGGEIEISRGDRLSDREMRRFPIENSSTKKIVEILLNDLIDADDCERFLGGSKLALLLDYFGGFSELEANVVIKELIEQLSQFNLVVDIIYTGTFHASMETSGFHISILNLSSNSELVHYLIAPTLAYSWPNNFNQKVDVQMYSENKNNEMNKIDLNTKVDSEIIKLNQENVESTVEVDVLLAAIEFACEAVIACATNIDSLDTSLVTEETDKCGTRLASAAEVIKTTIRKKKFNSSELPNIIFQIALIFEQNKEDPQAELYSLFFKTIGRAIKNQSHLEATDWLDAFVKAIDIVDDATKGTKFSDTLYAAKTAFCDAYEINENVNVIEALGEAVNAAQMQASPESEKLSDDLLIDTDCGFSGPAGAHAIGVWMRGAYEGIKLKYSHPKTLRHTSNKRQNLKHIASNEDVVPPKISKLSEDEGSF